MGLAFQLSLTTNMTGLPFHIKTRSSGALNFIACTPLVQSNRLFCSKYLDRPSVIQSKKTRNRRQYVRRIRPLFSAENRCYRPVSFLEGDRAVWLASAREYLQHSRRDLHLAQRWRGREPQDDRHGVFKRPSARADSGQAGNEKEFQLS